MLESLNRHLHFLPGTGIPDPHNSKADFLVTVERARSGPPHLILR